MNPAAEVEIERDLVRWRRGKWIAIITGMLAVQGSLFFYGARRAPEVRTSYPPQPSVEFARFSGRSELLELQDASLFASANPRGFSGSAWITEPLRNYVLEESSPQPSFLAYRRPPSDSDRLVARAIRMPHQREKPEPTEINIEAPDTTADSRLEVEGYRGRRLVALPDIPAQYASDVVKPTIVQSLVDGDGVVLSARVLESSGSKVIDNTALDVARRTRFSPLPAEQRESVSIGKMTFRWQTLDASSTNKSIAKPRPGRGAE